MGHCLTPKTTVDWEDSHKSYGYGDALTLVRLAQILTNVYFSYFSHIYFYNLFTYCQTYSIPGVMMKRQSALFTLLHGHNAMSDQFPWVTDGVTVTELHNIWPHSQSTAYYLCIITDGTRTCPSKWVKSVCKHKSCPIFLEKNSDFSFCITQYEQLLCMFVCHW